jgi:hypothetical protein
MQSNSMLIEFKLYLNRITSNLNRLLKRLNLLAYNIKPQPIVKAPKPTSKITGAVISKAFRISTTLVFPLPKLSNNIILIKRK